jgi:hypothetical protein
LPDLYPADALRELLRLDEEAVGRCVIAGGIEFQLFAQNPLGRAQEFPLFLRAAGLLGTYDIERFTEQGSRNSSVPSERR